MAETPSGLPLLIILFLCAYCAEVEEGEQAECANDSEGVFQVFYLHERAAGYYHRHHRVKPSHRCEESLSWQSDHAMQVSNYMPLLLWHQQRTNKSALVPPAHEAQDGVGDEEQREALAGLLAEVVNELDGAPEPIEGACDTRGAESIECRGWALTSITPSAEIYKQFDQGIDSAQRDLDEIGTAEAILTGARLFYSIWVPLSDPATEDGSLGIIRYDKAHRKGEHPYRGGLSQAVHDESHEWLLCDAKQGDLVLWRSNMVFKAVLRMPRAADVMPAQEGLFVRLDYL